MQVPYTYTLKKGSDFNPFVSYFEPSRKRLPKRSFKSDVFKNLKRFYNEPKKVLKWLLRSFRTMNGNFKGSITNLKRF